VHVDVKPKRSCVTPVSEVEGKSVTTIEGLKGPQAQAVQRAWSALDVPRCGYCQSAQVMSAVALLRAIPRPTDAQIDAGIGGNVCRCATSRTPAPGTQQAFGELIEAWADAGAACPAWPRARPRSVVARQWRAARAAGMPPAAAAFDALRHGERSACQTGDIRSRSSPVAVRRW